MSVCQLCPKKSSIDCCDQSFCEVCIADHITKITEIKHKPMPSNLLRSHEMTKAIHKKICNELLELQEFKNSALKVISGFSSELKIEIDNYVNKFKFEFLQSCRGIQIELETAAQVLYTNNIKNNVLGLFGQCKDLDDVGKISIICKKFELPELSIKPVLENSLFSEIKILVMENTNNDFFARKSTIFNPEIPSNNSEAHLHRSQSLIQTPNLVGKFKVLDFSKPIADTLYSIFPFSNKIFSFNIKENTKSEVLLDSIKFPSKSAWTLTKDGKLIITGGFDESAKKSTISVSFHNNRAQEYPKMLTPRFNHAQITIDNHIYVFGGMNKSSLQECEKFNLDSKKWSKFASLNVGREFPSVAHHYGKIYVVGGNGIQSIESCTLNSKKFDILLVRLPLPGKVNIFFIETNALILQKEKVLDFNLKNNTYKLLGQVPENNLWTSSEYLFNNDQVFWVSDGKLVSFDSQNIILNITE